MKEKFKSSLEYLINITDDSARWTVVLCGLAILLAEDTTDFLKTNMDCDGDPPQLSIGILSLVPEDRHISPHGLQQLFGRVSQPWMDLRKYHMPCV